MDSHHRIEAAIQSESNWLYVESGKKNTDLSIAEKLFILTIEDERGEMAAPVKSTLRFGLAGALLAELTLRNKFRVEAGRLVLIDPTPTFDRMFDEIMGQVALENKPHKVIHWVEAVGSRQIVRQVAERLSSRNVISVDKERYTWISPTIAYPQVDGSAKYCVKQCLREIILVNERVEAEEIILFSLLRACQLQRFVFTCDEREAANKKVDTLVKGEVFGRAVAKILEKR